MKKVSTVEEMGKYSGSSRKWTFGSCHEKLGGWPWPQALHPLSLVQTRCPFFAVLLQPNNEHLFQKRNYKAYNETLPYTVLNI